MQFTSTILALLATAVSAAPLDARACSSVAASPAGLSLTTGQSQTVSFAVPAGAVGACSLEAVFPAGFPIGGTRPQVNVFAIDGPAPGALVGTVTFTAGERRTINSFACRPSMQYRLEIASWQTSGSVSYAAQSGSGLVMTYGC